MWKAWSKLECLYPPDKNQNNHFVKGGFTINVEGVYVDFEFFRGGGFETFLSQNKTRYAEGGGSNCAEIVGFFITFKRHVIKLCLAATLYKLSANW